MNKDLCLKCGGIGEVWRINDDQCIEELVQCGCRNGLEAHAQYVKKKTKEEMAALIDKCVDAMTLKTMEREKT